MLGAKHVSNPESKRFKLGFIYLFMGFQASQAADATLHLGDMRKIQQYVLFYVSCVHICATQFCSCSATGAYHRSTELGRMVCHTVSIQLSLMPLFCGFHLK